MWGRAATAPAASSPGSPQPCGPRPSSQHPRARALLGCFSGRHWPVFPQSIPSPTAAPPPARPARHLPLPASIFLLFLQVHIPAPRLTIRTTRMQLQTSHLLWREPGTKAGVRYVSVGPDVGTWDHGGLCSRMDGHLAASLTDSLLSGLCAHWPQPLGFLSRLCRSLGGPCRLGRPCSAPQPQSPEDKHCRRGRGRGAPELCPGAHPLPRGDCAPQGHSGHPLSGTLSTPQLLSCRRSNQILSPQLGPSYGFAFGNRRLPHLDELFLTMTGTVRVTRGSDDRSWITILF